LAFEDDNNKYIYVISKKNSKNNFDLQIKFCQKIRYKDKL